MQRENVTRTTNLDIGGVSFALFNDLSRSCFCFLWIAAQHVHLCAWNLTRANLWVIKNCSCCNHDDVTRSYLAVRVRLQTFYPDRHSLLWWRQLSPRSLCSSSRCLCTTRLPSTVLHVPQCQFIHSTILPHFPSDYVQNFEISYPSLHRL